MGLDISLDPALERALADIAARTGRSVEDLAREAIAAFVKADQGAVPVHLPSRRGEVRAGLVTSHDSAIQRLRKAARGDGGPPHQPILWSDSAIASLEEAVVSRRQQDQRSAQVMVDAIESAVDRLARQKAGQVVVSRAVSVSRIRMAVEAATRAALPDGSRKTLSLPFLGKRAGSSADGDGRAARQQAITHAPESDDDGGVIAAGPTTATRR